MSIYLGHFPKKKVKLRMMLDWMQKNSEVQPAKLNKHSLNSIMKDKLITYPRIYNSQGTECFFKLPEEF